VGGKTRGKKKRGGKREKDRILHWKGVDMQYQKVQTRKTFCVASGRMNVAKGTRHCPGPNEQVNWGGGCTKYHLRSHNEKRKPVVGGD